MRHNFEERRAARIEGLENRAIKAEEKSDAAYQASHDLVKHIPMGQPILVGHHSEGYHRRTLDRSWNKLGESVKESEKAKELERRAESARNNTAIFSDDPNATEKLAEKIERLEARQEMMKSANKLVKKKDVNGLMDLGFGEAEAVKLIEGDRWGYIGFASFTITNNGANIRRLKERLAHQQKLESIETSETEINGVKLVINAEANRTQIFFPGKPSDETRRELKSRGFRWAPSEGAWQRHISNGAIYWAQQIAKNYA